MPRRARFTVENGTYHVMLRGNNRAHIFHNDNDFSYFLELLKDNKKKFGLKIYHYSLMDNHIHLVIQSPIGASLSTAMKRITVTYTRYYRKIYKGIGHFFQDRFKSFLIQEGKYLLECGRYVELNPVRAGMVKSPEEYKWSSYSIYAGDKKSEIVDFNPEYEGLGEDKEHRAKKYREYIMSGILERRNQERFFKQGLYGSKKFIESMSKRGLKSVWSHGGKPKKSRFF
ncbi:MAG: transposase [Elusimicrobiota bacterium]